MEKSRSAIAFVVVMAVVLLSGCATVFDPGPDEVEVRTEPEGADVYVDGQKVGTTPTSVALQRGRAGQIRIEKEGYEPVETYQTNDYSTAFFVSVGFSVFMILPVPAAVDWFTDNHRKFDSAPVEVRLTPEGEASFIRDEVNIGQPVGVHPDMRQ